MTLNVNFKRFIYLAISMLTVMCMCIMPAYAWGRKIIPKTINGSMTVWSAYHYNYYFTSHAVLTYNDSNQITQISDLSFTNIGYTSSHPSLTASFTPRQLSKSNNGSYATYVVQLTRNVYGYYSDNINYTLTYRPIDSGSPYSLGGDQEDILILIDVEIGEPYNIKFINEPSLN